MSPEITSTRGSTIHALSRLCVHMASSPGLAQSLSPPADPQMQPMFLHGARQLPRWHWPSPQGPHRGDRRGDKHADLMTQLVQSGQLASVCRVLCGPSAVINTKHRPPVLKCARIQRGQQSSFSCL
jgi:hypothetical protein